MHLCICTSKKPANVQYKDTTNMEFSFRPIFVMIALQSGLIFSLLAGPILGSGPMQTAPTGNQNKMKDADMLFFQA